MRDGDSKSYISVNNKSKSVFLDLLNSLGIDNKADGLIYLCKHLINSYDRNLIITDSLNNIERDLKEIKNINNNIIIDSKVDNCLNVVDELKGV